MRRHPIRMLNRVGRLLLAKENPTDPCVTRSYDRLSKGYDAAWTDHIRDLSTALIERLDLHPGMRALDLTCGTGFVTGLLADCIQAEVVGVDRSAGMLAQARQNIGDPCRFVQADILSYVRACETNSLDIVTCAWGLGYSHPLAVLKQIKRILKPNGQVALIDNSLFSLAGVMFCSILAFAEHPEALQRLMRFRFLSGQTQLHLWLRLAGLKPLHLNRGQRSYFVSSGAEAIARLRATGAAAGFEYAAAPEHEDTIFQRFAEILEQRYCRNNRIRITHRYIEGVARA